MKQRNKNICPEEWIIQAFVDGELVGDEFADTRNHINSCIACMERVAKRRVIVNNITDLLEISITSSQNNKRISPLRKLRWISIAASVVIIVGLGIWFFNLIDNQVTTDQNCQWVVLNVEEFDPNFESPNRLFKQRLINISETDEDGNTKTTYLIKQCRN